MNSKFNLIDFKNLIVLFATYLAACISYQYINSLLITYGKDVLEINAVAIASVGGLIGVVSLILRPFIGFVTDRINARKIYICSFALLAFVSVGFCLSKNIMHLRFCQYVRAAAWTLLNVSGQYMIGRMFADKSLGRAVTIFMLGGTAAGAISGATVLKILNAYGYTVTFMVSAVFNVLAIVLSLFIEYDEGLKDSGKKWTFSFDNFISIKVIHIMFIAFVFQIMDMAYSSGFIFDFAKNELSIEDAGLFLTITSITGVIGRLLYAEIYDKKGFLPTLFCYIIGDMAATLLLANTTEYTMLIVSAVCIGLFSSSTSAILQAEAVKIVGKEKIGAATSTRCIGNDIGLMFGSVFIAAVAELGGSYRNSFNVLFVINVCMLFIVIVYAVYKKKNIKSA